MPKYEIPNLKRACDILSFMGDSTRKFTCNEIAKNLDIPRTTAVRILETFVQTGFLKIDDKKYSLGESLIKLGNIAAIRANIGEIAYPYLKRLTELTGETSHIGILSTDKVLIARVCESPLSLHAASRAGSIVDLHCSGTGKILLAEIFAKDPSFISKIKLEKRTKNTITTVGALKKNMEEILKQGFSLDDEEYHESIRCMAVPVRDHENRVIASLGITAPAVRFEKCDIPKIYKTVSTVSEELSRRLRQP